MRSAIVLAVAMLSGCASVEQMEARAPDATFQSAKTREAVADCLLNRLTSPELNPEKTDGQGATTVAFTSAGAMVKPQPAIYVFTIRDDSGGSVIEARRLGRLGFNVAETCF